MVLIWDQLVTIDHRLRAWVVTHRMSWLDLPMALLSAVGWLGLIWLVIATALALRRRVSWRDVGKLALTLAVAVLISDYALKPAIQRERPFVATPEIQVIGPRSTGGSFPSGHAAAIFAGAVVLSRLVPAARRRWWLLAIAVAYSRLYLGVHYPLDVFAGAAVGVACAIVVSRLLDRIIRRSATAS